MTLYFYVPWKKSGNILKMSWMLFVFQMSPLPGTSVLYLSVAFEPNLLLLASLRLAVGLAGRMVEVQRLAVWCCLVSILSVCVFALISVLTDMRDGKWRLMCNVFSGLDKGVFNAGICSMWAIFKVSKAVHLAALYELLLELESSGLDAVWATDPWTLTEADLKDPAPAPVAS